MEKIWITDDECIVAVIAIVGAAAAALTWKAYKHVAFERLNATVVCYSGSTYESHEEMLSQRAGRARGSTRESDNDV